MRKLFSKREWIIIILIGIVLGLILSSCAAFTRPELPDLTPPKLEKPVDRPALKENATPKEKIDRRISDLEGALAQAKSDREAEMKQEREKEDQMWRSLARWVGAIGFPLCAIAAGIGVWFGMAKLVTPIVLIVAGAIAVFMAFAESLGWIAAACQIVLGLGVLVGIPIVIIKHRDKALVETAKLGDAIEGTSGIIEAKLAARAAQIKAGVHNLIQKARGRDPSKKQE